MGKALTWALALALGTAVPLLAGRATATTTHKGTETKAHAPKPGITERTRPTGTGGATVAQLPPVKGMVWVNLSKKVYHKGGDHYYGNTKRGKFMTEQDAIKAGYKPARTGGARKHA